MFSRFESSVHLEIFDVEGVRGSARQLFGYAKERMGYKGELETFEQRLRYCGGGTWATLCKPTNTAMSKARKAALGRKREEMAAVIAALDARKKALAGE